jgi:uncharacterized membrane protein YbhN (UPF0104 family)
MTDAADPPKRGGGFCGVAAGLAFLLVVGLPVLFVASFANSPCQHGPCNPNGPQIVAVIEAVLLVLAAVAGLLVAFAVNQWDRSRESKGRPNGSRRLGVILLIVLLAVAGWIVVGLLR